MSTKTEHTPGPWKIHNNIGRKAEIGVVADAAPCIIAIMGNAKAWPMEADANARLIAAAPEMFEALTWAESFISGFEDDDAQQPSINPKLAKIRKAIHKAKGGK